MQVKVKVNDSARAFCAWCLFVWLGAGRWVASIGHLGVFLVGLPARGSLPLILLVDTVHPTGTRDPNGRHTFVRQATRATRLVRR